jgi:branched-chain amino acid transport system substrate-binding protein
MRPSRSAIPALALGGILAATVPLAAAEPCPAQCASGKVPLGIAAPLSGTAGAFGRPTVKAAEIAIDEVNKAGGLLGIPVASVAADDRCDAGMAATVAKRHIESNVAFVIGPTCPAVVMDAAPVYAKAGVIQFVPTVTSVGLTEKFPDNMFRMVANDAQEAKALAAYLEREQAGKKIAIVFGEFFYRRAIAKMIDQALSPEQKKTTRLESLADVTGASDRLADQFKKSPPDLIYISLDPAQAATFIAKLRERGIKSVLLGGQHFLSASFWRNHRSAAEGVHILTPIASLENTDFIHAAETLMKAQVIPDMVALSNFAAVQVWAEAVRRAGSGDPKAVVAALRADTFKTAVGNVAFDGKGDRRDIRFSILTWKDGLPAPGLTWRQ